MKPLPFAVPPALPWGAQLARVVAVRDPEQRGRVQVQLFGPDPETTGAIWVRVAVAFAGDNYGATTIPDIDEEVLVVFAGGDWRAGVIVGSLWNGATTPPETIGGRVDRWTFTGKKGTRIAIVEDGVDRIRLETPGGVTATLTDQNGGKIELVQGGNTITAETRGITVTTSAKVTVNASQIEATAGQVTVNAGMSRFSGVVQCDVLIANSVVSASYTPGAGNVW